MLLDGCSSTSDFENLMPWEADAFFDSRKRWAFPLCLPTKAVRGSPAQMSDAISQPMLEASGGEKLAPPSDTPSPSSHSTRASTNLEADTGSLPSPKASPPSGSTQWVNSPGLFPSLTASSATSLAAFLRPRLPMPGSPDL